MDDLSQVGVLSVRQRIQGIWPPVLAYEALPKTYWNMPFMTPLEAYEALPKTYEALPIRSLWCMPFMAPLEPDETLLNTLRVIKTSA